MQMFHVTQNRNEWELCTPPQGSSHSRAPSARRQPSRKNVKPKLTIDPQNEAGDFEMACGGCPCGFQTEMLQSSATPLIPVETCSFMLQRKKLTSTSPRSPRPYLMPQTKGRSCSLSADRYINLHCDHAYLSLACKIALIHWRHVYRLGLKTYLCFISLLINYQWQTKTD